MGLVTAAVLASTALTAYGQYGQSRAQKKAATANLQYAEMAAEDVEARGREEIAAYQRQLSQVTGQQRVGLAAQGIDLTQGTAAEIARQTADIGSRDIAMIRRNIEREAWGIRTTGDINYRTGIAQAQASMFQAAGTLIGAAGRGWEAYSAGRPPKAQPGYVIPAGQTVMRNPLTLPAGSA